MENKGCQILTYLTDLNTKKKTKKREPEQTERGEFFTAWTALVKEEGFSKQAEQFLYSGISYCGAKPFQEYINGQDNSLDALDNLYRGELYRKNCRDTTTILVHLLALNLNEPHVDVAVIASLMEHITSAIINKEGNPYSQADRVLKKYLFDVLRDGVELPKKESLLEHGMDDGIIRQFFDIVGPIAEKIIGEGHSKACECNIQAFDSWLHELTDESEQNKNGEDDVAETEGAEKNEEVEGTLRTEETEGTGKTEGNEEARETRETKETEGDEENEKAKKIKEVLETASREVSSDDLDVILADHAEEQPDTTAEEPAAPDQSEKVIADLQERLSSVERENSELTRKIYEMTREKSELKENVEYQKVQLSCDSDKIAQLTADNRQLNLRIQQCEEKAKQLQNIIDEHVEMVDMLRRDRQKQADEGDRRLASMLKPYYLDYQDAKDLDMSIELGENIRDQLGDVLKIVSNAGIMGK